MARLREKYFLPMSKIQNFSPFFHLKLKFCHTKLVKHLYFFQNLTFSEKYLKFANWYLKCILHNPRKSQKNEKNILFQFLCLPLSLKKCVQIWFEMSSVTSVEKRESRKHFSASACSFLGLGLRPRPQKCGLGFKKLFLDSLFSTSVTLDKSQIRLGQIFPQTW